MRHRNTITYSLHYQEMNKLILYQFEQTICWHKLNQNQKWGLTEDGKKWIAELSFVQSAANEYTLSINI